ncbi:MAG TPA: hypothetical protein VMK12_28055, partial [Anaeromyxobacteraceae bacterium]|nr:hypothetical protein [Anaeromyxobacteraceae bacterium]
MVVMVDLRSSGTVGNAPWRCIKGRTMLRQFAVAPKKCDLPFFTWYQATKHILASHGEGRLGT